jgi:hypothetical protein
MGDIENMKMLDLQETLRLRGLETSGLDDEDAAATVSPFGSAIHGAADEAAARAAQAAHMAWLGGEEAGARLFEAMTADGRKETLVIASFGWPADDRIRHARHLRAIFADWAPSPLDPKGACLDDRQSWVVSPFRIDGGTEEPLALSNYRSALARIGGEGPDVEVHRFKHWGPGWVEFVLVRPFSEAEGKLEQVVEAWRRYPVIDGQDLSALEAETFARAWDDWGREEFLRLLAAGGNVDEETLNLLSDAGSETTRSLFESLIPEGPHADDSGAPRVREAARRATADLIRGFLETARNDTKAAP